MTQPSDSQDRYVPPPADNEQAGRDRHRTKVRKAARRRQQRRRSG